MSNFHHFNNLIKNKYIFKIINTHLDLNYNITNKMFEQS
jgi:hypothetical protein